MPIILDDFKLSYTPIPKIACTSLKMMFFEIENDRDFTPFYKNGREIHIHNIYPSIFFNQKLTERQDGYRRLLLVRDPLQRLLSAYSNRVIHHKELSEEKAHKELLAYNLKPNPNLQEFIENLHKYVQAVETIDHHTRPLVDFAGKNSDYYSKIYKISAIGEMVSDISTIVGRPLKLNHLQTGGPKLSKSDLSSIEIRKLEEFYAEDYKIYGNYF